jgi:GMP synthase (glutamine-hydrolysing)
MKRLLVVQHTFAEFLGALEPEFEAREIGFSYVRTAGGDEVAGSPSRSDGLWLLGSAYPIADSARCPWLEDEKRLVRAFQSARVPVVGLGEGAHVLAAANGAMVSAEGGEARFAVAHALDPADPLAQAVDQRSVLVMASGSTSLPEGALPVVADASGRCIAFRTRERGYGLLFRPELKPGMLEDMVMEEDRPLPANMGELLEVARADWPRMRETTSRVAAALVEAQALMDERRRRPVFEIVDKR